MSEIDLRIASWNANGIVSKRNEIEFFLSYYKIDVLLISETHLTPDSRFTIKGYSFTHVSHPSGRARGGAGVLTKNSFNVEPALEWSTPNIQLIAVKINSLTPGITVAAIYCPPNNTIDRDDFHRCFNQIPTPFMIGGDFNAKHTWWASRIVTRRGTELLSSIQQNHFHVLSTGTPTYWPSNNNVIPDLLDFFIYFGISPASVRVGELPELYSDHIGIVCSIKLGGYHPETRRSTDFKKFQLALEDRIVLSIPMTNPSDIDDAVSHFNAATQTSIEDSTVTLPYKNQINVSLEIRHLIAYKRRLRVLYQTTMNRHYKTQWNSAGKRLRAIIHQEKEDQQQMRLQGLGPGANDDYSLWKALSIKKPTKIITPLRESNGEWIRSDKERASKFADHLETVFQPNTVCHRDLQHDTQVVDSLLNPPTLETIEPTSFEELTEEIRRINTRKAPGLDSVSGRAMKSLPLKAITFLTMLFNAILQLHYFPTSWKVAEVIMIRKPEKPPEELTSYRPISLLPIVSKIFERILLRRLSALAIGIIPDHQFGFRKHHGTIQQCHRVVSVIRSALEEKKYCISTFLDIAQAFDRVWHQGLLWKVKHTIPAYYHIIHSFISGRKFTVKYRNEHSSIRSINAGVPQGSVLGPFLYCLATADFEILPGVTACTFADDTAFLASHSDPQVAVDMIQSQLHLFHEWCDRWKIRVNPQKSVNVNFTLNRGTVPALEYNGNPVPVKESVRYLGLHIDSKLNWKEHVKKKHKQTKLSLLKLNWVLRPGSGLSVENKLLIYKTVVMPIWRYGCELWGSAAKTHIKKMQSLHCTALRRILGAPWFIRNINIQRDTRMPDVLTIIRQQNDRHLLKLESHENTLVFALTRGIPIRRLKRWYVTDLGSRFNL